MPRAGLSRESVVGAALAILDEEGRESVGMADLAARLGVRAPSLYHHVSGADDLQREMALRGVDLLADACRTAAMGRTAGDALRSLATAYRTVASENPGAYRLAQTARPDDPEWVARSERALEPVLAVLAGYGLLGDEGIHAARSVRSALHGFVTLERRSGFGLDVDPDESFAWMVDALDRALSRND